FGVEPIDGMLGQLATLLRGFVASPGGRLSDLELLSPQERECLLGEWLHLPAPEGGRAVAAPGDPAKPCLHQRFEGQARRRPGAVAVTCAGGHGSYAELNGRADRLARRLRRAGIGPESLVGVHLDRSVDLIVAILGVAKAGGAYLPLDDAAPVRRLEFILSDA